jgi:hypothetical protein
MPARSGAEYFEPILQEPIRAIAEQYDMQRDPGYRDVMTYAAPTAGQPVSR